MKQRQKAVLPQRRLLVQKFGTLRMAAQKLSIRYQRLSAILHCWETPNEDECKKLGISVAKIGGQK